MLKKFELGRTYRLCGEGLRIAFQSDSDFLWQDLLIKPVKVNNGMYTCLITKKNDPGEEFQDMEFMYGFFEDTDRFFKPNVITKRSVIV